MEEVRQPHQQEEFQSFGCSLGKSNGLRAFAFDGLLDLFSNRLKCLIPGDTGPFSFSPVAGSFQRVNETVGVVEPFNLGKTLGADRTMVQGTVGVALDLFNSSTLDMGQNPTPAVIHPRTISFNDHYLPR